MKKISVSAYFFILPAYLFFFAYILYPVFFLGYGSLFNWSTLSNRVFVGLGNYTRIFSDPAFSKILRNTLLWMIITISAQAAIGFTIAYLIEEKIKRFRAFFRTIFFLPVVSSVVVIAIIWSNIYKPYQGILMNFLNNFGIPIIDFLGSPDIAIFSIIIVNIWQWTGWSMVLYIAGIAGLPSEVKDSALVDGAGSLQKIFRIYLPMLSGIHRTLIMLGILGSLQTFALIYSMTGGGPFHATEMPATYIFQTGFMAQQMGYASAISIVVLLFALLITAIQIFFHRLHAAV